MSVGDAPARSRKSLIRFAPLCISWTLRSPISQRSMDPLLAELADITKRYAGTLAKWVAVIGLTAFITHWRTLGFEWYCKTTSTTETWSPDRAYQVTLLKKDCHQGESIFYSVRVHAFSPPNRTGWFLTPNSDRRTDIGLCRRRAGQ